MLTTIHPALDSRIFYREALSLHKYGYEIVVIGQHLHRENKSEVKIIPGCKKCKKFFRPFLSFGLFLKALESNCDAFHFHDPEFLPYAVFLRFLGKRVVYDIHEDYPEVLKYRFHPFFNNFISKTYKIFESAVSNFFDALVFPTSRLAQKFKHKNKIVLRNFLPSEKIKNIKSNHKKYDVIHVGTVSPKRMGFFLRIMDYLKEEPFKWVFIGLHPNTLNWLKRKPEFYNNSNYLFLGKVPFEEVMQFLAYSKVGINYHPFEERFRVALPVKVFEYLFAGLPIVSTGLEELMEILGDQNSKIGYFLSEEDNTPEVFAQKLKEILSSEKSYNSMSTQAIKIAFERLRWIYEEDKLYKLYTKLLRG